MIGQTQSGVLYIRYSTNSMISTAEWCKASTDRNASLFYCKSYSQSSVNLFQCHKNRTWKFQFYSSFLLSFFFLTHNIYYINAGTVCVCVYVCVCLSVCSSLRDLRNKTSYRRASFAGVKRFSWRVTQTAFRAYMTRGLRGKGFGTFRQVTHWSPCTHVTLPGSPGTGWILPTTWMPLEHSWRSRVP